MCEFKPIQHHGGHVYSSSVTAVCDNIWTYTQYTCTVCKGLTYSSVRSALSPHVFNALKRHWYTTCQRQLHIYWLMLKCTTITSTCITCAIRSCMRRHFASFSFEPLQPLPVTSQPLGFFARFLIKQGQPWDHVTDETETLGLYVDVNDGWKLKATTTTSLWDKFSFTKFVTSEP